MRRVMAVGIALCLVGVAGGSAQAERTLTETKEYNGSQGFAGEDAVTIHWTNMLEPSPRSVAPRWARSVSLEIIDESGQPVAAHVHIGDKDEAKAYDICAETEAPLKVQPNTVVEVSPMYGTCEVGFSMPTSGTVAFRYGR